MASSTLYREGDDLDTLLSELSADFGPAVRVLAIDDERPAGVLGRFARRRVGVQFRVEPDAEVPAAPAERVDRAPASDPLADLIERADAAETARPAVAADPVDHSEFASMLREMAAAKALRRSAGELTTPPSARPRPRPAGPVPPVFAGPPPALEPSRALPTGDCRPVGTRTDALVLRRRLAEIGVPLHLLPTTATDPLGTVRTIVAALPEAPRPPVGRGMILALAGPGEQLVEIARNLATELPVPADRIWTAGLPVGALPGTVALSDGWDAGCAARQARDRLDHLVLALVATDAAPSRGDSRRPARIVAALNPDALWAVVAATQKPADTRRGLAALGPVTAAVVVDAAATASPGTVLELGVPVALLDGCPATRQRWTEALLGALAGQPG